MNDVEINKLTEKIIGCAIEVHRHLGPGLREAIYEKALCYEFDQNGIKYKSQYLIPIWYKKNKIGSHRLDILVENEVVVELKAVDKLDPVYYAQLLGYLKLTRKRTGLLINFNSPVLKDGIKRMMN